MIPTVLNSHWEELMLVKSKIGQVGKNSLESCNPTSCNNESYVSADVLKEWIF